MRRWRSLSDLAPETAPRTEALARVVKAAIETVLHHPRVAEATRAVARRALGRNGCPLPRRLLASGSSGTRTER